MKKLLKGITIVAFLFTATFTNAEFIVQSYQEIKNQRVVRQTYEESCGASSLATLINLIDNQKLNELEILKLMSEKSLHTDMVSFTELKTAVQKLGFEANSYALNREIFNKLINIPLLVKIEDDPRFPHFVVIINHKGNYLQILDPSYGEYISSKREFYSIWDRDKKGGYALVVVPKQEFKRLDFNFPNKLNFEKRVFGRF
ncbi:C39 family peptidase [Helicobacter apodemus]|uniref:Peptidase C39 n=1 Tax=Helicobacter apodemus TaxID=135569 RepID=A0A2U8FDV2_9HELI|nr:C39 family peptidase [Helicobacter apodemus]AWI34402.1 peptidase C39 [Helicobacter apodemus]